MFDYHPCQWTSLSAAQSVASQNNADGNNFRRVIGHFFLLWWDSIHLIFTKLRGKSCHSGIFSPFLDGIFCHTHSWWGMTGEMWNLVHACLCTVTFRLWASRIHLTNDQRWHISASGESQVQGKNSSWLGANVWPRFEQNTARASWKNRMKFMKVQQDARLVSGPFPFTLFLSLLSLCRMDASSFLSSSRPCQWLPGALWMRSWDVRRCTLFLVFYI